MGNDRGISGGWKAVGRSVRGPSHERDGSQCQDYHRHHLTSSTGLLVLAVSDGAGSCEHSHIGAESAVNSAIDFCIQSESRLEQGVNQEFSDELVERVFDDLASLATESELPIKSLSCTLLLAVWSPQYCFAFQVGDGTLSVEVGSMLAGDSEGVIATLFVDQSEYINETSFVTEESPNVNFQILDPSIIKSFILGSDGIDPLATAGVCASPDFYHPILKSIRSAACEERLSILESHMQVFLESEKARERSDDDKTLLIAAR